MADFKTHITTSTVLGVGYGATAYFGFDMPMSHCFVAGAMCSVAGMLPDLDSDSGVPVRVTASKPRRPHMDLGVPCVGRHRRSCDRGGGLAGLPGSTATPTTGLDDVQSAGLLRRVRALERPSESIKQ